MAKILLVTVGGSPSPIIRSIKEYHPDFGYCHIRGMGEKPLPIIVPYGNEVLEYLPVNM